MYGWKNKRDIFSLQRTKFFQLNAVSLFQRFKDTVLLGNPAYIHIKKTWKEIINTRDWIIFWSLEKYVSYISGLFMIFFIVVCVSHVYSVEYNISYWIYHLFNVFGDVLNPKYTISAPASSEKNPEYDSIRLIIYLSIRAF